MKWVVHPSADIANANATDCLADVERLASDLATEARSSGGPLKTIGVGLCEIVDRSGRIASANCLDWTSASVHQRLSKIAPTVIEADVRVAVSGGKVPAICRLSRQRRVQKLA